MNSVAPRQRRKDARPQELLDAALRLFVEKGFAATRSEEVAAQAGVSKGTLYLYYPSKEDLLKAVIRQTLSADIAAGAALAATQTGPVADAIQTVLAHWWVQVFNSSSSGVFKLALTEMCNFPEIAQFYAEEVIQPGTAVIASLVQRGIDQGEFRPLDVPHTVHSIIMPMIMMCLHKHSLGVCGFAEPMLQAPERFVQHHLHLVLEGMRLRQDSTVPLPQPADERSAP